MSSNHPNHERYEAQVRNLHDAFQREKQDFRRRERGTNTSQKSRHSRDRSISPTGHTETARERYHRKKEKQNKYESSKYATQIRNRKYDSGIVKKQTVIPAMSLDVNVTSWWQDAGVKEERKFIIALAHDELLSTKLKEKIPFESWLSLSVKIDDQFRSGRMEILYERKYDTEEDVDDELERTQQNMWNSDPEGKYNTKMVCVLERMPPVVSRLNLLDSVPMPTKHNDVRLLLKALQIL